MGAQILPAGTYVFKLLDNGGDRNIVQVSNQAEDHVFTTILAIPNYRLQPTGKTVMTFKERGEGQPEAIRAWFYPGKEWGQEFVYPKARALWNFPRSSTSPSSQPLSPCLHRSRL